MGDTAMKTSSALIIILGVLLLVTCWPDVASATPGAQDESLRLRVSECTDYFLAYTRLELEYYKHGSMEPFDVLVQTTDGNGFAAFDMSPYDLEDRDWAILMIINEDHNDRCHFFEYRDSGRRNGWELGVRDFGEKCLDAKTSDAPAVFRCRWSQFHDCD